VDVNASYFEGDAYYDMARNSSALHVAAWRARPEIGKELLARGASVNAIDAQNRTALQLAVKACIDSYWTTAAHPIPCGCCSKLKLPPKESNFPPAMTRSMYCCGLAHLVSGEASAG
jgi:hypothetical protein